MRYITDLGLRIVCTTHDTNLVNVDGGGSGPPFTAVSLVPTGLLEFDLTNWCCLKAAEADEKKDIDTDMGKWEGDKCIFEVVWVSEIIRQDEKEVPE